LNNLAIKIKFKQLSIALAISILAVLVCLNWYQTLLFLKIPISLLGYSRSFYSVYLFIILLPVLLVLPTSRINVKLFIAIILIYVISTVLVEYQIRSANEINLRDRISIYAESEVSNDAIDNMHLTKMPLGIIYSKLSSFINLPNGDVGSPYRKLFSNQLALLLALAQITTVITIIKAICSMPKYRFLSAVLGIAMIKHVFDGGFLSSSGLSLFVVFTLLLSKQTVAKTLNTTAVINIIISTFVICLISSIIIKKFVLAVPEWEILVLERQLWACGVLGTTLLIYSLYERSWSLLIISFGIYIFGLYVNPIFDDDFRYAYQSYQPGQRLAIFVNSPTRKIVYLNLKRQMLGHEIYKKYNLRPGFNWVSTVTTNCLNKYIEFFFKVRGNFTLNKPHKMANLSIKKCSSMEWCDYTVKVKLSECLSIQSAFPEIVKYLLTARQPIFIRDILRSNNLKQL
jgi:hypothetical protein